jgi:hypothetical protein
LGRLVRFPRTAARRGESEWHDPAENAPGSTRKSRKSNDALIVTLLDLKTSRETQQDLDGGGGSAA